ncbi:purine nucleoside transporter PunC [Vibrio penaeicida]|uniref:purine nucleoside transporter PunC n=1 Tax=Vibrio penaeicida TaxID=104609 RepID=UPI000CE9E58F|nr:purine nucleoside transporter PunC [Vibrio penaeicida]
MNITKYQLFYLACLSMLGFIATDMYLPAFKAMEQDLTTGPESIALSLSIFLGGLAVGQLVWGLASDKFGHRKTLVMGLLIFSAASMGLVFTKEIWQLLSLRFIQAIGVCAPAVIWQAMVISQHSKKVSQQIFSTIMPLVALSPALAPQLGVLLLNNIGWRSIFIALTLMGVVLAFMTLAQKESNAPHKSTSVKADISALMHSRVYLGNVMMFATASAAFFAYLTGMPEIMAKLGYDAKDIGMSFIPQTIAFMLGGYLGKRFVGLYGDERVLKQLLALFSVSSMLVFAATQWALTTIYPLLIPFCFIAVANGALYPIVVNRALSSAKQSPATAAGLQNSLQICISGLASALVAWLASDALKVTGIAIIICLAGLWLGYFVSHEKAARHFTLPDNSRVARED